jgi:hypothetical protein
MIRRFVVATVLGLTVAVGWPSGAFAGNDDDGPSAVVPEPASLVLLVSGLGALGWTIRRRR